VTLPYTVKLLHHRVVFSQWADYQSWLGLEQGIVADRFGQLMCANCKNAQIQDNKEDAEEDYDARQERVCKLLLFLLHKALEDIKDENDVSQVERVQPVEGDGVEQICNPDHQAED
jgi:hypothetical protein